MTRCGLRRSSESSFRPSQVSVLMVGESPPANGTFFYHADSHLSHATREAFATVIPGVPAGTDFLWWLRDHGWYLVDLSTRLINRLPKVERRRHRRSGETRLASLIAELRPSLIVAVLQGIKQNVERALRASGHTAHLTAVPFLPACVHQSDFRRELAQLARVIHGRGQARTSSSWG